MTVAAAVAAAVRRRRRLLQRVCGCYGCPSGSSRRRCFERSCAPLMLSSAREPKLPEPASRRDPASQPSRSGAIAHPALRRGVGQHRRLSMRKVELDQRLWHRSRRRISGQDQRPALDGAAAQTSSTTACRLALVLPEAAWRPTRGVVGFLAALIIDHDLRFLGEAGPDLRFSHLSSRFK